LFTYSILLIFISPCLCTWPIPPIFIPRPSVYRSLSYNIHLSPICRHIPYFQNSSLARL
jgi:hypothetical protein